MLGLYLALSAWITWRAIVLAPYSDMYDWVAHYYAFNANWMDWTFYLFAPHNFHRLPWTFGALLLDIRLFGAQGYVFPAMGIGCLGTTAWLLVREAARAAEPPLRLAAATLTAMLSLLAVNLWAAGLHIHLSYLQALVFAVAALLVGEPLAGRPVALWRRVAVLLFAMAAALGNGAALVLWPVLVFSAVRTRDDWRWTLTLLLVGFAFVAAYVGREAGAAAVAAESGDLLSRLTMILNFLGLPWSSPLRGLGAILGAAVLSLGTAAVLLKGGPNASRSERVAVKFVLYSLGAAALAAVGRTAGAPTDHVTVRYATFLTPLHVGFVILALPYAQRLWATRPRAVEAAALASGAFLFASQTLAGTMVIQQADANLRAVIAFRGGSRDPALQPIIYPRLERAWRVERRMRKDGFFQHELRPPPAP